MTIKSSAKSEFKFAPLTKLKSTGNGADAAGGFEGCANFCGYLDDGGDVIPEGGFADVIDSFLKSGFIAHSHEWSLSDGVIGYPMQAHEDADGLYISGKFHSTTDAQNVRTKMQERIDDGKDVGLSIGYRPGAVLHIYPKDYEQELPKFIKPKFLQEGLSKAKGFKSVRVLKKIEELKECSVVTSPMNVLSNVTSVKSNDHHLAMGLADQDQDWDAALADARVREWAGAKDAPNDRYAVAFLYHDKDYADDFDSYHLGFADVIDGKLMAVPAAIIAATNILNGPREQLDYITDANLFGAKGKVSAYYEKMREAYSELPELKWEVPGDELESEIVAESYKATCEELGMSETKIGARNAEADKKQLQVIHDAASAIEPSVCRSKDYTTTGGKENDSDLTTQVHTPAALKTFIQTIAELKEQREAEPNDLAAIAALLETAITEFTDVLKAEFELETKSDSAGPASTESKDAWQTERFQTERLRTAASRQRAGLSSGLAVSGV